MIKGMQRSKSSSLDEEINDSFQEEIDLLKEFKLYEQKLKDDQQYLDDLYVQEYLYPIDDEYDYWNQEESDYRFFINMYKE